MTLVPFNIELQIRQDNRCGEGIFLGGQRPYYRKEARPKRSPILGFPYIYAYTLCRRTTKFLTTYRPNPRNNVYPSVW